ncbi:MAG: hypothetical protein K5989_00340 [Lachnospiraceae bacterium]|nr:hypothetical protein [Lachnospiraceae bacterium]
MEGKRSKKAETEDKISVSDSLGRRKLHEEILEEIDVEESEIEDKSKDWHTAFFGGLQLEFPQEADSLIFEREHLLNKEPIRIDILIQEKEPGIQFHSEIGRLFRKYNVIEYKGVGDELTIDTLFKGIGYACLYKGHGNAVNEIPVEELTLSIFRYAFPRKLFQTFRDMDIIVERAFPGIYYISGIINFPIQIIVIGEFERESHPALQILTKNAKESDVRAFLLMQSKLTKPGDKANAKAVMIVSSAANPELFSAIRKEEEMKNVLKEIMKEDFQEEIENAVNIEREKAEKEREKAEKEREKAEKERAEKEKERSRADAMQNLLNRVFEDHPDLRKEYLT